jgi:hypothetical protein
MCNELIESDDLAEDLAKRWPALFQKSRLSPFSTIPRGWANLIDTLCGLLSRHVSQAEYQIDYWKDAKNTEKVEIATKQLEDAINDLPIIADIKEKFGALRVYCDNSNHDCENYILFAEALSTKVCEQCGNPGELVNINGWSMTRCNTHLPKNLEECFSAINTGRTAALMPEDYDE